MRLEDFVATFLCRCLHVILADGSHVAIKVLELANASRNLSNIRVRKLSLSVRGPNNLCIAGWLLSSHPVYTQVIFSSSMVTVAMSADDLPANKTLIWEVSGYLRGDVIALNLRLERLGRLPTNSLDRLFLVSAEGYAHLQPEWLDQALTAWLDKSLGWRFQGVRRTDDHQHVVVLEPANLFEILQQRTIK